MRPTLLLAGLIAAAAALPALAALAQDAPSPLTGEVRIEMNLDVLGRRPGRQAQADLYTKSELGLSLSLPAGFSLQAVAKLEPTGRERGAADRGFADQGGWIEQLTLGWGAGPVEIFAGKIHPRFGFAWDRAPGLYGQDFGARYELAEKLGAGARLAWSEPAGLAAPLGEHDVQIELFQADRSLLSESAFAPRFPLADPATGGTRWLWRNRRATGGPDNTRGFGNLVLSADGRGIAAGPASLDDRLGYSAREAGLDSAQAGTARTERGAVAGRSAAIPLGGEVTATPFAEWLRLDAADGVRGARRDVLTAALDLARKPLALTYVYNLQRDAGPSPAFAAQHSVSVTYDLAAPAPWLDGFEASLGWRRLREDGAAANDYGAQLVYAARF